jgi:hypothetical protein
MSWMATHAVLACVFWLCRAGLCKIGGAFGVAKGGDKWKRKFGAQTSVLQRNVASNTAARYISAESRLTYDTNPRYQYKPVHFLNIDHCSPGRWSRRRQLTDAWSSGRTTPQISTFSFGGVAFVLPCILYDY